MKTDKKILKSASFITGAFLTTSLAATPTMSPDILAYNDLGSGAQVRSHLIDQNLNQVNSSESIAYKFGELKCGEGKCGEGKCGEGKCGEGEKKAETKTEEVKTAEADTTKTTAEDTKKKEPRKEEKK